MCMCVLTGVYERAFMFVQLWRHRSQHICGLRGQPPVLNRASSLFTTVHAQLASPYFSKDSLAFISHLPIWKLGYIYMVLSSALGRFKGIWLRSSCLCNKYTVHRDILILVFSKFWPLIKHSRCWYECKFGKAVSSNNWWALAWKF